MAILGTILACFMATCLICWRMRYENDVRQAKQLVRVRNHLKRMIEQGKMAPETADALWQQILDTESETVIRKGKTINPKRTARQLAGHKRALRKLTRLKS